MIKLLKSKLHHIRVTKTDVDYVGSIRLPAVLMKRAGIYPLEEVHVWDVTNGARYTTYAVPGPARVCEVMGPSAHLINVGDVLVIGSFQHVLEHTVESQSASVVIVDPETNGEVHWESQHAAWDWWEKE